MSRKTGYDFEGSLREEISKSKSVISREGLGRLFPEEEMAFDERVLNLSVAVEVEERGFLTEREFHALLERIRRENNLKTDSRRLGSYLLDQGYIHKFDWTAAFEERARQAKKFDTSLREDAQKLRFYLKTTPKDERTVYAANFKDRPVEIELFRAGFVTAGRHIVKYDGKPTPRPGFVKQILKAYH